MSLGFGREPVDPDFVAFKQGLEKAIADSKDRLRWRWSPKHRSWYVYPATDWVLEDLNLRDTPPGDAVKVQPSWPESTYEVGTFYLAGLWDSLEQTWRGYAKLYPSLYLVWSPWGNGDWRNVLKRTAVPSPAPPPGPIDLPQRALDEIAQIKEWHRRGVITADTAQKMINDVVSRNIADA